MAVCNVILGLWKTSLFQLERKNTLAISIKRFRHVSAWTWCCVSWRAAGESRNGSPIHDFVFEGCD